MREIFTLEDIEAVLVKVTTQTTSGMLADMTLDRVRCLAEAAGSPQERLQVVHVAGTSGKTSTAHMTAYLLRRAGKNVGLTVSPGVVDMREWVQLSDELLNEEEFARYFAEYHVAVSDIDFTPTRFEYLMVFALWVFDKVGVDYAVVETGLGGTVDASNICRRADKLCVITDIGFDHVGLLGDTLGKIAAHKAGIIASGNTVVMHEQVSEVMDVFRKTSAAQHTRLIEVQSDRSELFMRRNARLSFAAYCVLAERDGLPSLDENTIVDQVATIPIPGRLQYIDYRGARVLLDGAHNQQKMQALASTLRVLYPDVRWSAVYAMKDDKDYAATISEITPLLERVVVAPLHQSRGDMKIEGVPPAELAAEFGRQNVVAEIAPSVADGLDKLVGKNDSPIIVTGSLYAVAEVLKTSIV